VANGDLVDPADPHAVGEVHREDRLGRELGIAARRAHERAAGVVRGEALEVALLDVEVQLVGAGALQLVDQVRERQRPRARLGGAQELVHVDQGVHQRKVLGDGLRDAGALHLDGDDLAAVADDRPVDLRDRRAAQGRVVELAEQLVHRAAELLLHAGAHVGGGHRGDVGAQLREGVAVLGRQDVGMGRRDLAELDERRAEVLEYRDGLLWGEPLGYAMALEDAQDLAQALAAARLVGASVGGAAHLEVR
jgi:hypothetical protein